MFFNGFNIIAFHFNMKFKYEYHKILNCRKLCLHSTNLNSITWKVFKTKNQNPKKCLSSQLTSLTDLLDSHHTDRISTSVHWLTQIWWWNPQSCSNDAENYCITSETTAKRGQNKPYQNAPLLTNSEARHFVPLYVPTCSGMTIKLNLTWLETLTDLWDESKLMQNIMDFFDFLLKHS